MRLKKILVTIAALSGFFIAEKVQATCSNYSTYVDGQTLTASSLNSLQTNYTNCVNAVLDGDTFTGNVLFHSGSDALFYSDTGSTLKAAIYGDGARAIVPLTDPGSVNNCGISVSGSTFTIAGDDGTALSATNPCQVAVESSTAGRTTSQNFTSNVTFTFGATSNTDGNLFGITDANWANVMPFFIGVVYNGTTPYFVISRVPLVKTGSAATNLCQKDDTDCDGAADAMILTTGLTLASWVNLPITPVGWFAMTYATTGGAWTATTPINTGFNFLYENTAFSFPVAQMGAAASTHFLANGGTAPLLTTNIYGFKINRFALVTVEAYQTGDAGTDGAGAVTAQLAIPYAIATHVTGSSLIFQEVGIVQGATTIVGRTMAVITLADAATNVPLSYQSAATTNTAITNAMFSNGARELFVRFSYNAVR